MFGQPFEAGLVVHFVPIGHALVPESVERFAAFAFAADKPILLPKLHPIIAGVEFLADFPNQDGTHIRIGTAQMIAFGRNQRTPHEVSRNVTTALQVPAAPILFSLAGSKPRTSGSSRPKRKRTPLVTTMRQVSHFQSSRSRWAAAASLVWPTEICGP